MLKVIDENYRSVHLREMKDGDIAIIRTWKNVNYEYIGRIVQQCRELSLSLNKKR